MRPWLDIHYNKLNLVPWCGHFSQNLNYGAGIFLYLISVAHPFFISAKEHFVFFLTKLANLFSTCLSPEQNMTPWIDAHINRIHPDSLILILSLTPNIWHAFFWANLGRFTSTETVQNLPEGTFGKLIISSSDTFLTSL